MVTMTIGCFLGIRAAWPLQTEALSLIESLDAVLARQQLPPYQESGLVPTYRQDGIGRSVLDHHDSEALADLANLARERRLPEAQLALLRSTRHGAMFLPLDFALPLSFRPPLAESRLNLGVGSAPRLQAELRALGHVLGIPLKQGDLKDKTALRINDHLPLYAGDRAHHAETGRTAWLLLYEGARLAQLHQLALILI
ncbi:MAG: hypothetical protein CVV27_17305 [Candidatus Melainabacteria bacterium HGW-Melainabacteria-1]|nr:MAG: hypothetical protein CVV27_17305 [Candidatus Melainabacteria bacterium HGW-Melainabacteria-1]